MNYDRELTISSAGNRFSSNWPAEKIFWSAFVTRLATPVRGTETLATYLRMPKSQQDTLKDRGGFVAGELAGGRRKRHAVKGRDIVTLDMDALPAGGTDDALRRVGGLGCGWAVYSTRKHSPDRPRLRIMIPLAHTVTADEYEPIARKLAEMINIGWCDPTTFQAVRMMYWPSCSADAQYVYLYEDKPFVDPDGILNLYKDWHDMSAWPQVPGQTAAHQTLASRQEDPTSKPGIVGAFCRQYNVYQVMEEFLPGIYEPVDGSSDRYTFTGGSTTGGAVVYDNGSFLYSHHATDPAGGRLVNSFDLLRLHKFGDLDDEAKEGTPTAKLPSYTSMKAFAVADDAVALALNQERYRQTIEDFGTDVEAEDPNWMARLKLNPRDGKPDKCAANVLLLLENDPQLKDKLKKDTFADRVYGVAPLPWGARKTAKGDFAWCDEDDSGLRIYVDQILGFRSRDVVDDAFRDHVARHSYNPVVDYLLGLQWDETPRLDALFIDYLGAEDTPYTRAVTRKAFTAAVARAMEPGVKYDFMPIPTGTQGLGKSTLLQKMGRQWFSDSLKTFDGKEASEQVQGVWIVEIAEMEAFNKSTISRIKQFLSQREDIYRPAYGRVVEWHPRRCVFFGTSNDREYLRDRTGNRRFWPVDTNVTKPAKSVFTDLDDGEVDQLWAEAVLYWRLGEPLYLAGEIAKAADTEAEEHRERGGREGVIADYVERKVPEEWPNWDLQQRLMWLGGGCQGGGPLIERERICALEVYCECLKGDIRYMKYVDAVEINSVIAATPGWERTKGGARFGYAGYQRGFVRSETS
jgi:predicted P-loop ATPase